MKEFFEDYLVYILAMVLLVAVILVCVIGINNNNQSVITDDTRFTWAIIQLGNGELIEGCVTQWNVYNNAHVIQVTLDNNLTIITDIDNVLLCNHEP